MIEQTFKVGDTPQLKIQMRSGSLEVRPGREGEIAVTVDTNSGTMSVEQRGDTVVVGPMPEGKRARYAAITAEIPDGADLEVATASADVVIRQRLGRFDVATASGEIRFGDAERLQAKSASGDIRGAKVTGESRAVTASGDIRISEVGERASLSTASGDIQIKSSTGRLTTNTVSGDIRVDEVTGPEIQAKSMSGRVRLGIPKGTRLDLDANTYSGKVKLPSPDPSPGPPEREMTVKVRLVSGDLRIARTKT